MKAGDITVHYIGFALLGSAFFFILGYVLRKYTAKMKVKRAEDKAKNIITKSKVEAERRKRESALEAKDLLLKMRTEFEEETRERRKELSAIERRLLQRDGGDIELVSVKDGVVKVSLRGACAGCPMSQMTLKNVVEQALKEAVPEIKSVETV